MTERTSPATADIDPWHLGAFNSGITLMSTSGTWSTGNIAVYLRGIGRKPGLATANYEVVATAGNISIGLYVNTGSGSTAAPGTRSGTTGSIACPSNGVAATALGFSVNATHGSHWWGFSCSSGSANIAFLGGSSIAMPATGWHGTEVTAHPIPTTATPLATWANGGRAFHVVGT